MVVRGEVWVVALERADDVGGAVGASESVIPVGPEERIVAVRGDGGHGVLSIEQPTGAGVEGVRKTIDTRRRARSVVAVTSVSIGRVRGVAAIDGAEFARLRLDVRPGKIADAEHQIENRDALAIASELTAAFEKFCPAPTTA